MKKIQHSTFRSSSNLTFLNGFPKYSCVPPTCKHASKYFSLRRRLLTSKDESSEDIFSNLIACLRVSDIMYITDETCITLPNALQLLIKQLKSTYLEYMQLPFKRKDQRAVEEDKDNRISSIPLSYLKKTN